jgi:hypothetical protein
MKRIFLKIDKHHPYVVKDQPKSDKNCKVSNSIPKKKKTYINMCMLYKEHTLVV